MQLFGDANASRMVRSLITEFLNKSNSSSEFINTQEAKDKVKIEIRLPRKVVEKINSLAEERISNRNYYLTSIILAHLNQPQLQGDEIEVLRRSNYELAKVGTNLNQVAKAFNTLVKIQSAEKLPDLGKKIASLRNEITSHTSKVLRVLSAGTTVWEQRGRGQRKGRGPKSRKV